MILGFISGQTLSVGRNDVHIAASLINDTRADLLARGAMELAIADLKSPKNRFEIEADGSLIGWNEQNHLVFVRVTPEAGRVDLNNAPPDLIFRLIDVVGGDATEAQAIAASLVRLRNLTTDRSLDPTHSANGERGARNTPHFRAVSQLLAVPGMTPDLYSRIADHVTVFTGRVLPDVAASDATVRSAATRSLPSTNVPEPRLIPEQSQEDQLIRKVIPGSIGPASDASQLRIETAVVSPTGRTVALESVVSISRGSILDYRVLAMRRTNWLDRFFHQRSSSNE